MLFCVGKFFSTESEAAEYKGAIDLESMKYLDGTAKIEVPTFFIDGGSGADLLDTMPDGGDICKNLHFLGRRGITEILGLKLVFISGILDTYVYRSSTVPTVQNYSQKDIDTIEQQIDAQHLQGKVDILLTSEWPQNILNHLHQDQFANLSRFRTIGASPIQKIAAKCSPRYHFTALEGFFFERPPYTTKIGEIQTVTRFIALAPVSDSKEKTAKYLYAAKLVPVSEVDEVTIPPNATASPFVFVEKATPKIEQRKMSDGKPMRQKLSSRKPPTDTSQCWFCLANPQVESHLLVSFGEESYLALPKGGLIPNHVLIVPLAHISSLIEANKQTLDEINRYIAALKQLFKRVIIFERSVKVSNVPVHMLLHVIPIGDNVSDDDCYNAFENDARTVLGYETEVRRFGPEVSLQDAIHEAGLDEMQYFVAEMPDNGKIIHEIPDRFIKDVLSMGRRPCASLLDIPEREDWHNCILSTAEEAKLVSEFKKIFKPYDFTN